MTVTTQFESIRLARRSDFQIIHEIITASFQQDPQLNWLLEFSSHKNKLSILARYIIEDGFNNGQIYITNDNQGIAIWKTQRKGRFSWKQIALDLDFLFKMGIRCSIRNLMSIENTNQHFPKIGPFYYLYILAVHPLAQGKGLASQLMNPVVERCNNLHIPIFLETGNRRNVDIYKRKGFQLTDIIPHGIHKTYYMRTSAIRSN